MAKNKSKDKAKDNSNNQGWIEVGDLSPAQIQSLLAQGYDVEIGNQTFYAYGGMVPKYGGGDKVDYTHDILPSGVPFVLAPYEEQQKHILRMKQEKVDELLNKKDNSAKADNTKVAKAPRNYTRNREVQLKVQSDTGVTIPMKNIPEYGGSMILTAKEMDNYIKDLKLFPSDMKTISDPYGITYDRILKLQDFLGEDVMNELASKLLTEKSVAIIPPLSPKGMVDNWPSVIPTEGADDETYRTIMSLADVSSLLNLSDDGIERYDMDKKEYERLLEETKQEYEDRVKKAARERIKQPVKFTNLPPGRTYGQVIRKGYTPLEFSLQPGLAEDVLFNTILHELGHKSSLDRLADVPNISKSDSSLISDLKALGELRYATNPLEMFARKLGRGHFPANPGLYFDDADKKLQTFGTESFHPATEFFDKNDTLFYDYSTPKAYGGEVQKYGGGGKAKFNDRITVIDPKTSELLEYEPNNDALYSSDGTQLDSDDYRHIAELSSYKKANDAQDKATSKKLAFNKRLNDDKRTAVVIYNSDAVHREPVDSPIEEWQSAYDKREAVINSNPEIKRLYTDIARMLDSDDMSWEVYDNTVTTFERLLRSKLSPREYEILYGKESQVFGGEAQRLIQGLKKTGKFDEYITYPSYKDTAGMREILSSMKSKDTPFLLDHSSVHSMFGIPLDMLGQMFNTEFPTTVNNEPCYWGSCFGSNFIPGFVDASRRSAYGTDTEQWHGPNARYSNVLDVMYPPSGDAGTDRRLYTPTTEQRANGGYVPRYGKGGLVKGGTEKVQQYQRWLNQNYNAGLKEDGAWGPKTQAAYEKYVVGAASDYENYVADNRQTERPIPNRTPVVVSNNNTSSRVAVKDTTPVGVKDTTPVVKSMPMDTYMRHIVRDNGWIPQRLLGDKIGFYTDPNPVAKGYPFPNFVIPYNDQPTVNATAPIVPQVQPKSAKQTKEDFKSMAEEVRKEAEQRLKEYYNTDNVSVTISEIDRSLADQSKAKNKGFSKTTFGSHNLGMAADYDITINGKKQTGSTQSSLDPYRILGGVAKDFGMFWGLQWDARHISSDRYTSQVLRNNVSLAEDPNAYSVYTQYASEAPANLQPTLQVLDSLYNVHPSRSYYGDPVKQEKLLTPLYPKAYAYGGETLFGGNLLPEFTITAAPSSLENYPTISRDMIPDNPMTTIPPPYTDQYNHSGTVLPNGVPFMIADEKSRDQYLNTMNPATQQTQQFREYPSTFAELVAAVESDFGRLTSNASSSAVGDYHFLKKYNWDKVKKQFPYLKSWNDFKNCRGCQDDFMTYMEDTWYADSVNAIRKNNLGKQYDDLWLKACVHSKGREGCMECLRRGDCDKATYKADGTRLNMGLNEYMTTAQDRVKKRKQQQKLYGLDTKGN